jgi:hypothetical protein
VGITDLKDAEEEVVEERLQVARHEDGVQRQGPPAVDNRRRRQRERGAVNPLAALPPKQDQLLEVACDRLAADCEPEFIEGVSRLLTIPVGGRCT